MDENKLKKTKKKKNQTFNIAFLLLCIRFVISCPFVDLFTLNSLLVHKKMHLIDKSLYSDTHY